MKTNPILVSIGLPVYNGEKTLKKAIDSLLKQSYANIELIISDNHSIDNTAKICTRYAKRDKRIRYYCQKINQGAIKNFNFVLKKSKGEYFMWAAHDDWWHQDFIKELLKKAINSKAVLAVPDYKRYDNQEISIVKLNNKDIFSRKESIKDFLANVSRDNTIYVYGLMKTSMLKKINGYHQDCRPFYHASDFVTIIRILISGKVVNVNKILFNKQITVLFFKKYDLLSRLTFNQKVIRSILRYFFDPLYNTLDLYYSLITTIKSDLNIVDKIEIGLFLTFYYLKCLVLFLLSIPKGLLSILFGLINRFGKIIIKYIRKTK